MLQRGHPSGRPKLPAGPPKLLEVLNSLSEVLYESQILLTRNGRFFKKNVKFSKIFDFCTMSGVRSACVGQKISALSNSQAVSLIHNKVRTHTTSEKILRGQTNLQILRNLCSKVDFPSPLASTIARRPTQQRNYSKSLRLYESCLNRVAIRQDGLSSRQGRPKLEKSKFPLAK